MERSKFEASERLSTNQQVTSQKVYTRTLIGGSNINMDFVLTVYIYYFLNPRNVLYVYVPYTFHPPGPGFTFYL